MHASTRWAPQGQGQSASLALQRHKRSVAATKEEDAVNSVQPRKGQPPETTLSKMKSRLQGGRFRMLNEKLYTTKGDEAFSLMQVRLPTSNNRVGP